MGRVHGGRHVCGGNIVQCGPLEVGRVQRDQHGRHVRVATSFNAELSNWDVSSVIDMRHMFERASSFTGKLCDTWFTSTADKEGMFDGSSGENCQYSPSSKEDLESAVMCLKVSPTDSDFS